MGTLMLEFLLVEVDHQVLLVSIFVILLFFSNRLIITYHLIHCSEFIFCCAYFARHWHLLIRNDKVLIDLSSLN